MQCFLCSQNTIKISVAVHIYTNLISKVYRTRKTNRKSSCLTARGVLPAAYPVHSLSPPGEGRGHPSLGPVLGDVGTPCSGPIWGCEEEGTPPLLPPSQKGLGTRDWGSPSQKGLGTRDWDAPQKGPGTSD